MIVHRVGYFMLDGTGLMAGTEMLPFGGRLVPPAARAVPHAGPIIYGQHNVYAVPLDDQPEHWHRLLGETRHIMQGLGNPRRGTHTGGIIHPDHAHVKLGGTIAWATEPHPVVQQHIDWLRALTEEQIILHLCGPQAFQHSGVY